ncbi:MAG TPA: hypothetical protein VHO25_03730 [Polyangiaceae bacterium]|nr:hypothetical protein [Polyangiaceae bacterium]
MPQLKSTTSWGILRPALAGTLAVTAAVEWGGAGPSKLVVGLLVFVVSYALLRSWARTET